MRELVRRKETILIVMLCFIVGVGAARADVKIKTKNTQGNATTEQTTYIKGKRQRTEMMNGLMISITQCDLQRSLQINPQTKTYFVNHYAAASDGAQAGNINQSGSSSKGGVVTTTITSKDTGERKQMFGYTARRVITTMVTESSPDACYKAKSRMEIDGWYIDLAFVPGCGVSNYSSNFGPRPDCQDRYQNKQIGTAKTGYPVWLKTTAYDENGREVFTTIQETIEISQTALDAALFEVPAGYREVKSPAEMYSQDR